MKTYPPTPPTRIEAWLTNLDGDHFAALVGALIVAVFVLCMVISIRARLAKPDVPARTRAVASGRKSGRVSS